MSEDKLKEYWGRHPYQRLLVVVLTIPVSFLVFLPIDYLFGEESLNDYIELYKEIFNQKK